MDSNAIYRMLVWEAVFYNIYNNFYCIKYLIKVALYLTVTFISKYQEDLYVFCTKKISHWIYIETINSLLSVVTGFIPKLLIVF